MTCTWSVASRVLGSVILWREGGGSRSETVATRTAVDSRRSMVRGTLYYPSAWLLTARTLIEIDAASGASDGGASSMRWAIWDL